MAEYTKDLGTVTVDEESLRLTIYHDGTEWRARLQGTASSGNAQEVISVEGPIGSWPQGGTAKTFINHLTAGRNLILVSEGYTAV